MRDYLFYSGELRDFFETKYSYIERKINSEKKEYILNVDEEEYISHIEEIYKLEYPVLLLEDIYIDEPSEIDIDVSHNQNYWGTTIKGSLIKAHIPFSGSKELFKYTPSTRTYNPPHGILVSNELILELKINHNDNPEIENKIDKFVSDVNRYLDWVKKDVITYNNLLQKKVRSIFDKRKEQFRKESSLTQGVRFPIKKRNDLPKSYSVPTLKKKIISSKPNIQKSNTDPYPKLSDTDFKSILSIISNMALVMEKSPKTFTKLQEEEIRDHFLMHLNGHFEGNATGETFNYGGKTDILIKSEGKNIFIAECKIWKGESVLTETIDQILKYTSWRDTKTAIILFNKNKSLSKVLSQIPDICENHNSFIEFPSVNYLEGETITNVTFRHTNDNQRKINTCIMVFDIPKL